MIAIIAAMDEEVAALRAIMEGPRQDDLCGIEVYYGRLSDHDVVLLKSGVGKTMAAITTTTIINRLPIEYIINIGSTGSLTADIPIGSVVIPEVIGFHDLEVPGWLKDLQDEAHTFRPDGRLLAVAKKLKDDDTYFDRHVSGDVFVYRKEDIAKIVKEFPSVQTVEMEAAAVANTATFLGVPFIVIRAVSDVVTKEGSENDFEAFVQVAAKNSAMYCQRFIEAYDVS